MGSCGLFSYLPFLLVLLLVSSGLIRRSLLLWALQIPTPRAIPNRFVTFFRTGPVAGLSGDAVTLSRGAPNTVPPIFEITVTLLLYYSTFASCFLSWDGTFPGHLGEALKVMGTRYPLSPEAFRNDTFCRLDYTRFVLPA